MAGAIRIGEPAIEVRLRRDPRARRMVLRVGRGTTLTLPSGVPLAAARAFLSDQEGWLRNQLARRPRPETVRDGTVLPFGDGALTLRASSGTRLIRVGDELHVPGSAPDFGPRVAVYLREAARAALVEASHRHAAVLGRRPGRISLRDPRSRWGSCTSAGDLMFSWRLILAPCAVLDYVAAHEVAHLAEMNHSDRFWTVVHQLKSDCDGPRDWLRRYGVALHRHDFTRGDPA